MEQSKFERAKEIEQQIKSIEKYRTHFEVDLQEVFSTNPSKLFKGDNIFKETLDFVRKYYNNEELEKLNKEFGEL